MQKTVLICAVAALLSGMPASADDAETTREILALERQVMDGWQKGNPEPALEISDSEITFFHVMTDGRLNGLAAVRALYESYRGMSLFDSYEMVEPKVRADGDMAVLTYIFVWRGGGATQRWNSTQVYRRSKEGWRVVHSHWSETSK